MRIKIIPVLFLLLLISAGCLQQTEQETGTVLVSFKYLGINGQSIAENSLSVPKGQNAWNVMKEIWDVEYEDYAMGPFIKSIEGTSPPEGYYLALYVNGAYADKGIAAYPIDNTLLIEWKTEKIESFQ